MNSSITLSIGIPSYNRPEWLKRALESIIGCSQIAASEIEIIISDDSTDNACKQVVESTLSNWSGLWKYFHNQPALGMAANWNRCIQTASGQYVLVLHDDDYLLQNGISAILQGIAKIKTDKAVLLFGVHVVNPQQQVMRKQVFENTHYLKPREALSAVLSNSSFVRFSGIVIAKSIFQETGYFNEKIGGIADLEMWVRLFKAYGVWCFSLVTAAYTVHADALTMQMFNENVISQLLTLFTEVQGYNLFSKTELEKFKTDFFHQFILAGTFRYLRRRRWKEASETMNLFQIPEILRLKPSLKWIPLRKIFEIIMKLLPRFT